MHIYSFNTLKNTIATPSNFKIIEIESLLNLFSKIIKYYTYSFNDPKITFISLTILRFNRSNDELQNFYITSHDPNSKEERN